jgi:hypothetical protein
LDANLLAHIVAATQAYRGDFPILKSVACRTSARDPIQRRYERRTRALARPAGCKPWAFVEAARAHPDAAQGTAREARETFARASMDARARDEAAMTEPRHG